jgi:hypothetical protein
MSVDVTLPRQQALPRDQYVVVFDGTANAPMGKYLTDIDGIGGRRDREPSACRPPRHTSSLTIGRLSTRLGIA